MPTPRDVINSGQRLRADIAAAFAAPEQRRLEANRAYRAVQADIVRAELGKMPVDRIKDVTQGRLQLSAIEKAGFRSVGAVLTAGPSALDTVPGVGPQTAAHVTAAARQLESALTDEVQVRLDPDNRTLRQAELLEALRNYEQALAFVPPRAPDLTPLAAELDSLLAVAAPAGSRLRMLFTGSAKKDSARDAVDRLTALLGSAAAADAARRLAALPGRGARGWQPNPDATALWNDFLVRPVAYNGLIIDVSGTAQDAASAQGFLPAEIAQQVRDHPLDLSLVTASLRGYQAFGAKFALTQQKVIIGDEMGLGKTVQALTAMAHLAAGGETHFLVVCPASVIVNWTREIGKHTRLTAHKVHGDDREPARLQWLAVGGVAVTTYEALRTLADPEIALDPDDVGPLPAVPLAMMTVDEAHYAKNPAALRTKAVRKWAHATERVVFLTGTPMENRVEEFRTLVGHLRPDVATAVRELDGSLGGTRFRRTVAPVYLRRNQDDVLSELPQRLETPDWVDLSGPALDAYRQAVAEGNFMKMRRAAFATGTLDGSEKLRRLADIVDEATEDGRKVVIFSFFRSVLDSVVAILGDKAVGPITGDVPPQQRQALVDEFTDATGPAVLVCQIQAGGVGLNIQAASVVIICEPQWNPAIEEQAIARAHRMGQVRRVDVHRLLAEHSVDQQMLEVTRAKRAEFDEYARRSDLAAATPDATDISDLPTATEVASQVEAERRIIEAERARLQLPGSPGIPEPTAK